MAPQLRSVARTVAVGASAAAVAAVALERSPAALDPDSSLGAAASRVVALVRFSRSLYAAARVAFDYRALFKRHAEYASPEYRADRALVHRRSAQRMLHLCRVQGAVYVKIGQHVASMSHAVPPEYRQQLRQLEDRAAHRPFSQIRRALERQLPAGLNATFSHFDPQPVAAASLAQVHRATLRDSKRDVAVKVQYPGLESLVSSDLTSISMLSWLLSWLFPFFNMHWVVDQFRVNLRNELDFQMEARSARRTANFFRDHPRVFVPHVYDQYSTDKLLVMDYVHGFRVDDVEAMHRQHIVPQQVAQTVVDAFAHMIFINGFVHCDPHPGNLMVSPTDSGHFRLYLLDHGLYRELNDNFRQSYCRLWKGFVLRDTPLVEQACDELGAPGFANVFSMLLLNRTWSFAKQLGTDIRVKMSPEEFGRIRDDLKEGGLKSHADVSHFVEQIPDQLILVFKMNSLVRNVNKALGAQVNRFKVNARYAVRGLRVFNNNTPDRPQRHAHAHTATVLAGTHLEESVWKVCELLRACADTAALWMDCVSVEVQLFALDVVLYMFKMWYGFTPYGGTRGGGNSDDVILIG
ncbi:putative aarF domain-containing protein kinase 1 [Gracilariopsis chorda]|uniref:Putative aarF domain-containing protein kinase 1 n=1 Tax=Gracilariopsis chorda TaxID=448386 RepID=A0A2V3INY5_9FLOR|nr:putative aarF domain-containing protein kinase 1 [Gracilariopsis chorda]|eukprot:PXF43767.1 putative aarF domain-containing protein kinase 1 [Gracilariopsis chorda]